MAPECALTDGNQWQLVTATDDDGKFNAQAIHGVVGKPAGAKEPRVGGSYLNQVGGARGV